MIDKYIAQASTVEEAIQKGLAALEIKRDEADVTVQDAGKKGFLGFGQRDAIVVVERKEKQDLVSDILEPIPPLDVDVTKKETDQPEKAVATESAPETKKQPAAGVKKDEDPAEMTEKTTESKKAVASEKEDKKVATPKEETTAATSETTDTAKDEATEAESGAEELAETAEELTPAEQDQAAIEAIADYLTEIIRAMNVKDVEVFISRIDNRITYDIETESVGLVIGRHGKVLNGLQTLAQNHMHQLAHSKLFVKVDAEKYRERRKSTVEKLADRTAEKVVKTDKKVSLNPMPAHERKQIHRYLNNYTGVKTHSEGKEPYRYLVVEPVHEDE